MNKNRNALKILALLLALVVATMSFACTVKEPVPEGEEPVAAPEEPVVAADDSLQKVLDSGKLVIAIESAWQPYCYMEEGTETLVGLDVDIYKAICAELGVEPEWFTSSSFDSLVAALDSGRVDVLFQSSIDSESTKYIFTSPFLYERKALSVAVENTEINSFEDIKGKLCANALGGSNAQVATEYGAELTKATTPEGMLLITQGRADCNIEDSVALGVYLEQNPEMAAKVKQVDYWEDEVTSYKAIRMLKGKDTLCEKLTEIIDKLVADGTFYEIIVKWAGEDVAKGMPLYADK